MNKMMEVFGKAALDSLVKIEIVVRDEYQKKLITAEEAMGKIVHIMNEV